MRRGLILSLLMHGALLAWAVFVLHKTNEFRSEPEAITVAMITPSELLRLKQGSEFSKKLTSQGSQNPQQEMSQKEAEKPKPQRSSVPPSSEQTQENKTKSQTSSSSETSNPPPLDPLGQKSSETAQPSENLKQKDEEESKKTELEKKKIEDAKRKAKEAKLKEENEKKKLEAKRKEEEAKKKAEVSDRLAALLDKDPTKKGAPLSGSDPLADQKGPTAGSQKGSDTVLALRDQDLLRGLLRTQIARCWRLPGGGGGTETPIVTLHWRMRPDGTLEGDPQVERPASGPLASLATEAAIRAVTGCQPFDLPQNLYENGWKEIIWEFDPTQML